jgi:hypothetical protein
MFYDCYVISCNGFRSEVAYFDGDRGRYVGTVRPGTAATERALIAADIREHPDRNGRPLFRVSDHGNISRARRVTLRRLAVSR